MANILSLAMKVSADASGVVKSLTPAERALENLGKAAAKTLQDLNSFASGTSGAAEAAANNFKAQFDRLNASLEAGLNAEEYARQFAVLQGQVRDTAAAFQEGARITEQSRTSEERRSQELQRLSELLELGAINQETYNRAAAQASGANELASQAERERAAALASASRIIEANLTPQERYDNQIQELSGHLQEGRLTQEQFNRAAAKAGDELNGVGKQADKTDKEISQLNKNVTLLSRIEVGRLIVDGLQALSSVFTRVASQVTSLVSTVNAGINTLDDLSQRTGIQVEALQGYSLAAKLAGVDTEQFGAAVQKLGVNIGKATPGDALDKALKGINLSLADLRALSPEQQFSEIGAAISQLPTAADRAAAAVALFGKQGGALAPLFREGAASLEELQARAERLGVIISETQVNNVTSMNDAFDLVAATINGIVGQVIGNLAPAVTAVTNEFLRFVEEFNGTTGEGGTGIANAITDVLLKGAEYFAGIFDTFVANFGSLGETFSYAADIFDLTSKILLTASEGIRVAFNAIQIGIDVLLMGFGKIVEALGSYVSDDLEQFGAGLAAASEASAKKNAAEMEAAATNAANTFNSIFTGGGDAEAAGQGAGQEFIRGLRSEIENARLPEVQVQADLASATADLDQFLSTAEGGSSVFLQQSQATLTTFSQMAAEGNLTADQIEIMNGFMENLNAELVKEKQNRQAATDAAEAQVDADRKRLDQLLQTNDEAARLEQDLLAVEREQARVSEQLAAARASDNVAQADAAAARQAELDQLQAKLEDQQQALEQGFGQGFQAAFAAVDSGIDGLIAKSQQFGQAGFDAAVRLQEGIAAAQEQAQAGILNQEAFNQEVQRQQDLFNNEIKNIEEAEKTRAQAAEDRVAAEKKQQDDAVKAQQDAYAEQQKAAEGAANEQRRVQEEVYKQQQKIFEEQQKAAAAEATRQEERLRKLNTLGEQSIQATDIRTVEGATLVTDLAASAQDPAMIQQRLQTKLLEKIAIGIGQAASNYFNQPVAIVGAARVGGFN
jgi:hypothetical protein